jgi:hypothetical protein
MGEATSILTLSPISPYVGGVRQLSKYGSWSMEQQFEADCEGPLDRASKGRWSSRYCLDTKTRL